MKTLHFLESETSSWKQLTNDQMKKKVNLDSKGSKVCYCDFGSFLLSFQHSAIIELGCYVFQSSLLTTIIISVVMLGRGGTEVKMKHIC